jgi:hypothetical protein
LTVLASLCRYLCGGILTCRGTASRCRRTRNGPPSRGRSRPTWSAATTRSGTAAFRPPSPSRSCGCSSHYRTREINFINIRGSGEGERERGEGGKGTGGGWVWGGRIN